MTKLFAGLNRVTVTAIVSLSVWITAILINTLFLLLLVFGYVGYSDFCDSAGVVMLLSAIFSLPGISIFWFVFLFNCRNYNLFMVLLITACCTSLLSSLICCWWLAESVGAYRGFEVLMMPVLAALAAVVLHRPAIAAVYIVQSSIHPLNNSESLET